jgi:hypothetical protein
MVAKQWHRQEIKLFLPFLALNSLVAGSLISLSHFYFYLFCKRERARENNQYSADGNISDDTATLINSSKGSSQTRANKLKSAREFSLNRLLLL